MEYTQTLDILFQDEVLCAVHKPPGIHVHRTELSPRETTCVMFLLRDQLGRQVYPLHRLDRPTSGLLLFAFSSETAACVRAAFAQHQVHKEYIAVTRGWVDETVAVDYPLKPNIKGYPRKRNPEPKPATTRFYCLDRTELDYPSNGFPTSRYSLVKAVPQTGRLHQIRRHAKHINHQLIGDSRYGDGHHNRFFRDHFQCQRMLLASVAMEIPHPIEQTPIRLTCPLAQDMANMINTLGWNKAVP